MLLRMWRERQRSRREGLREAIRVEVREELAQLLSLSKVDAEGRPSQTVLNSIARDLDPAHLTLKFFGYDLARRLAAALPPRTGTVAGHVGLRSKAATQADMEGDWVAHWCAELRTPVLFHRKLWELSYVLQAIFEEGHMRPGARGLGFGCGQESLPSYLAAHGVAITVTDLPADEMQAAGWRSSNQHVASREQAFHAHLVERAQFDALVEMRAVDMNLIPQDLVGYDFCWSICALEHLGSLERGLAFVENALATIRPGGLAVHTTEFNIDPSGPTVEVGGSVLYQRHHLTQLAERLRAQGHHVAELDFDLGDRPLDRFVDVPPYVYDLTPELQRWHGPGDHLKLTIDGFISTCFALLIRKAG